MVRMQNNIATLKQSIKTRLENKAFRNQVIMVLGAFLIVGLFLKFTFFPGEPKLDPVYLSFQGEALSQETPVKVLVDTKSYEIGFARVTIVFDNQKVELANDVTIDPRFATIIQQSTKDEANTNGEIVIAAGLKPGDPQLSGNLEIASLPFVKKGEGKGETKLEFKVSESQIVNMKAQELPLEKSDITLPLQ